MTGSMLHNGGIQLASIESYWMHWSVGTAKAGSFDEDATARLPSEEATVGKVQRWE